MDNTERPSGKKGTAHDYMLVIFGYERIYGFSGGGLSRVIQEAKEYNFYSLLESLSKIGLSLFSKGYSNKSNQIQLVRNIFAEDLDIRQRIHDLIVREKISDWAIFGEQPLLCLLKIILEHCPKEGGKLVSHNEVGQIGKWLLVLTDECMPPENQELILPPAIQIEQLREFVARSHFFMAKERLPYRFARFGKIFTNIEKQHPTFDAKKLFEDATGNVSLEDYRAFCFFLLVNWVNQTTKEPDITKEWIVCKKKYFAETVLSAKEIDEITDLLLLDQENYTQTYKEFVKNALGGHDLFPYNFLQIRQRPLISYNEDCFVCPDPDFLMDKATEGVYWIIENHLKEKDKTKWKLWPTIWGDAFEEYAHDRLSGGFAERYHKGVFNKTEDRSDGAIEGDEIVILVEIKYAHWGQKAKFTGYRSDMLPTLKQLFSSPEKCKGIGQIVRDIKDIEKGQIILPFEVKGRKILPLLIVGEGMPMEPLNRSMYEEVASKAGALYKNSNVMPFVVLDSEELEMLEAIAKENGFEAAEKLLIQYSSRFSGKNIYGLSEQAMEFKNFLHSIGYPVPNNETVLNMFDDLANSSRAKAFPQSKRSKGTKQKFQRLNST